MKVTNGLSSFGKHNPSFPSPGLSLFSARVNRIILNDYDYPELFREYGEWASVGGIFFSNNKISVKNKTFSNSNFAKPLFPNNKVFPLINELVYIIALPIIESQSSLNQINYYYFQPINIWNSIHHNALPNSLLESITPEFQKKDYEISEVGNSRKTTNSSTNLILGSTFKEKPNIKNLQPFEGDILYEGRWGQSIRFSSTILNSPNNWSNGGENGDPITIIRNGQHEDQNEPWVPQVEDINKDTSSIWLTSNQNILISPSSKDYNSYNTPPTTPEKYKGNQIILNSDRLLFNSKTDLILLSSPISINLNSQKSVNIDSKEEFIVNSKKVLLGNKNAEESVILGDKFLNDLKKLLTNITSLSVALQSPIGTPSPYVPNIAVNIEAVKVQSAAQSMLNQIERYKSKISKTV